MEWSAVTPNQQTDQADEPGWRPSPQRAALALGALGVAVTEQRDATLMSDDPTTTIAPEPPPPMTTGST